MNAAGLDQLIAAYSRVSAANKATLQKVKVVLARFHEQGIECILLKGADLIRRLYGVLGVRPMMDVDLLVHEHDLPVIDRILKELGYRDHLDGNPAYVDPERTLALDIITKVWYMDDQDVIWQRAAPRELDEIPIKGLGGNDLLIFLTAYSVIYRGYLSATFVQDVALLVEKEKLDWDFIVGEGRRRHVQIPLYHGLSYLRRVAGVPIPDPVLRRLAPSRPTEALSYFLFRKLVTDKPVDGLGHLLLFLTQPGWKKWRWLRESLFPSERFLFYRYGDRWNARPLMTRLSRPFSLLFQAIRLFIRIVGLQVRGRV